MVNQPVIYFDLFLAYPFIHVTAYLQFRPFYCISIHPSDCLSTSSTFFVHQPIHLSNLWISFYLFPAHPSTHLPTQSTFSLYVQPTDRTQFPILRQSNRMSIYITYNIVLNKHFINNNCNQIYIRVAKQRILCVIKTLAPCSLFNFIVVPQFRRKTCH